MRASSRWWLALIFLAACGGNRALEVPTSGASPAAPEHPNSGVEIHADASVAVKGPDTTVVAPMADGGVVTTGGVGLGVVAKSCDDLATGGAPDQLVDFTWEAQTKDCQSSACWTFIEVQDGCTLKVQRDDVAKTVVMNAADCAAARGWATNARFEGVLRDGTGCTEGTVPEAFELTLVQGDGPRRKTYSCDEPTVFLERACFGALADRLIPR